MPYDTFIGFTLLQSLQEHNNHHVSDNTTVRTLWNITVFCKLTPVTALKTFLAFPKLSWREDGITARAAFNSIDTVWVKKLRFKSWSAQWAPDKKIPNQANTEVKRLRMCERCRGGLEVACFQAVKYHVVSHKPASRGVWKPYTFLFNAKWYISSTPVIK